MNLTPDRAGIRRKSPVQAQEHEHAAQVRLPKLASHLFKGDVTKRTTFWNFSNQLFTTVCHSPIMISSTICDPLLKTPLLNPSLVSHYLLTITKRPWPFSRNDLEINNRFYPNTWTFSSISNRSQRHTSGVSYDINFI